METMKDGLERAEVEGAFIGVGCNRAVGAAAWGPCNLVAYAAHHSVAIFCPQKGQVLVMLHGHKDLVNCLEWLPRHIQASSDWVATEEQFLLSGGADGAICLWAYLPSEKKWRRGEQVAKAHQKAVTCIASYQLSPCLALFASTSSDGNVRVWQASLPMQAGGECSVSLLQTIHVGSRVMVAVTLTSLPGSSDTFLLAMGGLDNQIHLHVGTIAGQFALVCQLKGHQDWIRALDFSLSIDDNSEVAVFLASSAQDRIIRLWKISLRKSSSIDPDARAHSLKLYIEGPVFRAGGKIWQVSLESLLVGHEDWVYTVRWQPPTECPPNQKGSTTSPEGQHVGTHGRHCCQSMCVLSASMDRTMMIWKPDQNSGIWMNVVTVGELGHTALGFYGGAWGPHGDSILAHGYSGSLHLWRDIGLNVAEWKPQLVPSGHSAPVVDLAWAKTGQFLLSASHDQTTRVFGCWKRKGDSKGTSQSWHEIARPQIHGHNLNCLTVVKGPGNHRYVSGADEKVARVFEAPGAFLDTLSVCMGGIERQHDGLNREDVQILGANMSALGLSQKPIYAQGLGATRRESGEVGLDTFEPLPDAVPVVLTEPPLEEHLAHHTLWPESHKLYGHGNELFAMCCDHTGRLLATACKAQSANVADIWLWHADSWRTAGQLQSHTLTVTQMEFSHNSHFLLSVSRDRHLSVFQLVDTGEHEAPYKLLIRVEAHKRIIWACSWSPCDRFFATGSRDKTVKIWEVVDSENGCAVKHAITLPLFKSSITALAWAPWVPSEGAYVLAIGREDGLLELWKGRATASSGRSVNGAKGSDDERVQPLSPLEPSKLEMSSFVKFDSVLCHSATVHRLTWRVTPQSSDESQREASTAGEGGFPLQLASSGADHSVRIFNINFR